MIIVAALFKELFTQLCANIGFDAIKFEEVLANTSEECSDAFHNIFPVSATEILLQYNQVNGDAPQHPQPNRKTWAQVVSNPSLAPKRGPSPTFERSYMTSTEGSEQGDLVLRSFLQRNGFCKYDSANLCIRIQHDLLYIKKQDTHPMKDMSLQIKQDSMIKYNFVNLIKTLIS